MNKSIIVANNFPKKLYSFIEDEENKSIYWSKHGCAFYITDIDLLCDALQKYFKLTKLASFQRQLNLYGFRRLNKGAYFHPKFQRNRKDLLAEVNRLPGKGTLSTLEQVLNNTVEHIPNNKNIIEHTNYEVDSLVTKNNRHFSNTTNSIVVSNINTATIPTSALYLNSSQYQQQYNVAYNMQNPNNFFQYNLNNQSHYYPTSSVNSFNTLNSNGMPNNNSSISSSFENFRDGTIDSLNNNSNAYSSSSIYDNDSKYLYLSSQDHLILDSLIDYQTDSNYLDLDTEVNKNDQIQDNNNNTNLTSRMKENVLSAFINDNDDEDTNV